MAVSRVRKREFPCRHKGFGVECHRCAQADQLDALVAAGKVLVTHKKQPKPKTWTKAEMTAEAKRLRSV